MRARLILVSLILCAAAVWTAPLQIKLGSVVPVGSAWELALKKLAAEWLRLSAGEVKVIVYSGGTVGDEPSVVRKLRLGQLQAAGLTVRGLSQLDSTVLTISTPMLMRTDAELEYVLSELRPELESRIERSGQKVLFWIRLGWVYFYGRQPVIGPDDLRKQKFWVWSENSEEATVWKELNFRIVQLQLTDLLPALQSGMVDSFVASPLTAAAYQWFALAPHMTEMRWAPLFGALVLSLKTWDRVPAALQRILRQSADDIGNELFEETRRADLEAIAVMRRYGLKTYPVPVAAVEEWSNLMDSAFARLAGRGFDRETAEKVRELVIRFRAGRIR